jgi:hypothetical protein
MGRTRAGVPACQGASPPFGCAFQVTLTGGAAVPNPGPGYTAAQSLAAKGWKVVTPTWSLP